MDSKAALRCTVNGDPVDITFSPHKTLLEVLREDLGLTGTKHGCELGECGACVALVDGKPILTCLMLAIEANGAAIETVEGMADGAEPPLQAAFADHGATQCGYCTPAMLLTAKAMLADNPSPTVEEIRQEMAGVLCRCTGYLSILNAVGSVAGLGPDCACTGNASGRAVGESQER